MIMEIQAGDILRGRYEIQRLLRLAPDKGIYLAHDRVLDRPVVVDVFANNSIMPNGLTVSAWEARVLGRLDDHPNIATAQDYWEEGKRLSWSAVTSPAEPFWIASRARGNPVRACRSRTSPDRARNRERA